MREQKAEIASLKEAVTMLEPFREKHTRLEKEYQARLDELSMLKAKLTLDLIGINLKVVAEDPDLLEEKYACDKQIETLTAQLSKVRNVKKHYKQETATLQQKRNRKKERIANLKTENAGLKKSVKKVEKEGA